MEKRRAERLPARRPAKLRPEIPCAIGAVRRKMLPSRSAGGVGKAAIVIKIRLISCGIVLPQLPPSALPLQFRHAAEQAALCHQFGGGTLLRNPAVGQDDDLVRRLHGAHAVGDDQHRLARQQAGERFLHFRFVLHVQGSGGLVQ